MRDITITSLETITAFGLNEGDYLFTLDELQNTSIAQSQESTEITGKGGRKLATLKRNKAVTISGANGLVSGGLLEMQTGSDFTKNTTAKVMWTDYITVGATSTKSSFKAVGVSGSEIKGLYIRNNDGTLGAQLTQDSTASAGKFAYDPNTKAFTFHSDITEGTELVAFYQRNITGDTLENKGDKYSQKCALYIDALAEDKCGAVYRVQFYIPKADFNGEFTLEMGDNQTVHNFDAEALAGGCGSADGFWTYTIFENDDKGDALAGIAITTAPTKTTYTAGESFAPAGMQITATYENEDTAVLEDGSYTYAPGGALTVNDTKVTISYTERGVTKTATQAITVTSE